MTVARRRGDAAACDLMFSKLVRARGECEMPGCERSDVECAHIIGRRYSQTRTNELNAWALCPTHHYLVDNFADEKMGLVERTIGVVAYEHLRRLAQGVGPRFDWSQERERLKGLARG